MGAWSEHEALGIFVHDVHRRCGAACSGGVVGARHPRPPARHREAERRDPPPRPAARVRAWASGRGRGGAVAAGAPRPASCGGCAPRRACERRAAAAGWQVALAAAKFARLRTLDLTLVVGLVSSKSYFTVGLACRPLEVPSFNEFGVGPSQNSSKQRCPTHRASAHREPAQSCTSPAGLPPR